MQWVHILHLKSMAKLLTRSVFVLQGLECVLTCWSVCESDTGRRSRPSWSACEGRRLSQWVWQRRGFGSNASWGCSTRSRSSTPPQCPSGSQRGVPQSHSRGNISFSALNKTLNWSHVCLKFIWRHPISYIFTCLWIRFCFFNPWKFAICVYIYMYVYIYIHKSSFSLES